MHVVFEHAGRKRPKRLPELDLQVHDRLHLGAACVAENAARAQRPRPKLHAPLEPTDHFLVGDEIRNSVRQRVIVAEFFVFRAGRLEELPDLGR